MYFDDHAPPHFHATYSEEEAVIEIDSLTVLQGRLSQRAYGLGGRVGVASLHREELREAWNRAKQLESPGKIAPLE